MKSATRGLVVFAATAALALGVATAAVSPAAASPTTASSSMASTTEAASPAAATAYVHHQTHRACADARPGRMGCFAIRQTDTKQPVVFKTDAVVPNATPSGITPSKLDSAYKLSTSGGSGATVAIVDAFDDPKAEADLAAYRTQFGLPACTTANGCFRKVNQNGAASPLPSGDTGWAGEISLDVDMVSAICPRCHILLIEASAASDVDLYAAEDRAVSMGAKFVSNSWGGAEYSGQTTDDAHFNHPGVAITVSSGDDATGAEYPATSRYVTAVGGTTLTASSNTRGWTEKAWSDAGSGCSAVDAKPTWQTVTTNCPRRAEADVSAVADPNTGVAVYQTYGAPGWSVYGGTSVAAPIIAAVYALAGTPAAGTYPASYPYARPGNLFDVTTGSNGSCGAPICTAGVGWDGPTGLGPPNGTAAFASGAGTAGVTVSNPGNKTAAVGTAITPFTLTASGATAPYTWSATGLPVNLKINATSGTISGTPTTAGSYTVTATAATKTTGSGRTTFTISVSPVGGGCATSQLLGNAGFETGSAAPWTSTAGVVNANAAGETSHTGTYYAWLDGYGSAHTDTLSQKVTIPARCTGSRLSFWLHVETAETTTTTQSDTLTVTVGSTTEAVYSNLNHSTGYVQHSVNVGAFAGQTVAVTFTGSENSSLVTSFVIDDTALNVS